MAKMYYAYAIIRDCEQCPNSFSVDYGDDAKCQLAGRYIKDIRTIPSWCPLEDAEQPAAEGEPLDGGE